MQKLKLKIAAWATAVTLLAPSFAFAATTVSGNVYGNDGKTIKGASVQVAIPPDTELPPVESQDQGKFVITIPSEITIPATGLRAGLSASFNSVSVGPHSITIKPNQDNAFPLLLRLGTPGNSTSPTGEADVTTSGPIEYTSPDLSPIFKKKYLTLGDYLTDLVKVAMVLSVVGATLVVVYAGFDYLNSGGSPEGTAHAKEMIAGALLGIATVFMMSAFLVSLYDKETLKNLSPPATGQTTDQKQLLTTKLNTKLEQLKSLAQTAGVTLTPAQEQKIKSAIGTSANAGKPDAVKKAVREVADEIAKQKPQFKSIIDQQIGAVQKEIDKIFTENTVLSSQNQLQDNQTKITRITAPDCPTTTKGIEGIIRLEGCKAANQVVGELRLRPKKETCDKELFTNFALKANQYNPTDQQSSFNNFNDGFIEQCKKIRGTS